MAEKKNRKKAVVKKVAMKKERTIEDISSVVHELVLNGDIGRMLPDERVKYYRNLCQSLGMNPLTQPFQIIKLSGKEVLYATRTATDQLRKIYGVSIGSISQNIVNDICITTVSVSDKTGRMDGATGAVSIRGLTGDALANALMKSETKAKRRATLSICGLGMIDESEVETIPGAQTREFTSVTLTLPDKTQPGANGAEYEGNTGSPVREKGDFEAAKTYISTADSKQIAAISARLHEREWTRSEEAELRAMIGIRMQELTEGEK